MGAAVTGFIPIPSPGIEFTTHLIPILSQLSHVYLQAWLEEKLVFSPPQVTGYLLQYWCYK